MDSRATRLVVLLGLGVSLPVAAEPTGAPHPLRAREVVARIKAKVRCDRRIPDTVDTFKAGDPAAVVTGIVTTLFATSDVLARAAATGKNLIITHEPTFYEHTEDTRPIAGVPALTDKRAFIAAHHLIVWRFHDQIHCRRPDGIAEGIVEALGWTERASPTTPSTFLLPQTSVRALAADLRDKLKARAVRVVGNLDLPVTRIGLLPGAADGPVQIRLLARDDVEVLVAGEAREWETVEYVRDAVAQGQKKALILLGHAASEEAGMEAAALWLRTFIPEIPIEFVPSGDPFGRL